MNRKQRNVNEINLENYLFNLHVVKESDDEQLKLELFNDLIHSEMWFRFKTTVRSDPEADFEMNIGYRL